MIENEKILEAIQIIGVSKATEPPKVIDELNKGGFIGVDAEKMFCFITFAFGRVFIPKLANVHFRDEIIIDSISNEKSRLNFSEQNIYKKSVSIAEATFNEGLLSKELFESVMMWSPEINAMNDALDQGEDIENAEFAVPIFFSSFETKDWIKDF